MSSIPVEWNGGNNANAQRVKHHAPYDPSNAHISLKLLWMFFKEDGTHRREPR